MSAQSDNTALKSAANGLFPIGVGLADSIASADADWPLVQREFNVVTPENCLKPQNLQALPGHFNFTQSDQFINFATSHQLPVVGHCLIWASDDRMPTWYAREQDALLTESRLLERIRADIGTVVGRYRGRIAAWDVINEALADNEGAYLRESAFSTISGERFIAEAFRAAHAADPEVKLIYNDYNTEQPAKRAKLIRLLQSLREQQVPIDAVGLQGHFELDRIPLAELEATILEVRRLGLKLVISELDVDVIPRSQWWADGGKHREQLAQLNPYTNGCPPEILQRQAVQYGQLFELFAKYADTISRVTFWNLHDGQSWLNYFPWNRTNHPLLFDRQSQPKPAYTRVLDVLMRQPRP